MIITHFLGWNERQVGGVTVSAMTYEMEVVTSPAYVPQRESIDSSASESKEYLSNFMQITTCALIRYDGCL